MHVLSLFFPLLDLKASSDSVKQKVSISVNFDPCESVNP